MGNSFFKPYANSIGKLAINAGYMNHNEILVFGSGVDGRPIDF
jgi:cellobiose-specific phosphotransferase system component IIC